MTITQDPPDQARYGTSLLDRFAGTNGSSVSAMTREATA